MIRINLLPYREERCRRYILQHIMTILAALALALLFALGAGLSNGFTLSGFQTKLDSLQAQNKVLNEKLGQVKNMDRLRADVRRKLYLVDSLQHGRFRSLKTLIALSRAIPENVWLLSIRDAGGALRLDGLGESNKAVANFMRALDQEKIFADVRLQVIERQRIGRVPVRKFSLHMERVNPPPVANASLESARL